MRCRPVLSLRLHSTSPATPAISGQSLQNGNCVRGRPVSCLERKLNTMLGHAVFTLFSSLGSIFFRDRQMQTGNSQSMWQMRFGNSQHPHALPSSCPALSRPLQFHKLYLHCSRPHWGRAHFPLIFGVLAALFTPLSCYHTAPTLRYGRLSTTKVSICLDTGSWHTVRAGSVSSTKTAREINAWNTADERLEWAELQALAAPWHSRVIPYGSTEAQAQDVETGGTTTTTSMGAGGTEVSSPPTLLRARPPAAVCVAPPFDGVQVLPSHLAGPNLSATPAAELCLFDLVAANEDGTRPFTVFLPGLQPLTLQAGAQWSF